MPYALLVLGLLLGLYGLYRFFLAANPKQVKTLILSALILGLGVILFALALTGRLPAAIAIILALWPVIASIWKKHKGTEPHNKPVVMDRDEALAILGLSDPNLYDPASSDPANQEKIQQAYKRLMMKIHPDQQGSAWMAAKLNAARDFLLK